MASLASTKKTRAQRTSTAQYEELLSYMESHSEFASGKFLTKEGKIHHCKQWEELANKLNAMSNGVQKTTKQWQTVWRDMKSTASKKASKLRNERNRTGNFPITAQSLSTIDQRVVGCMGLDYVQGSVNCPDSTPEEEEYQLQLERGEAEVLYNAPTTTSIEDVLVDTSKNNYNLPSPYEENEASVYTETEEGNEDLCYNDVADICRQGNVAEIPAQENIEKENVPNSQPIVRNRRRTEDIRRKRRERIGVQLQEARENFTDIAEKHAEALKIFAEASMKQSENESRRLILEEKRLELEEKKIEMDGQMKKLLSILLAKIN